MSNQYLKLRRSGVPGKIPTTESIDFGEIALNTHDGLAFMKKSGSNGEEVVPIGSPSGSCTGNFTGSVQGTASWAENYNETDPVFTAVSGTFATTGSNTFIGDQIITGSIIFNEGARITPTYYGDDYTGYIDIVAGGPDGFVELLSYNSQSAFTIDDYGAYLLTSASYLWQFNNNGILQAPGGIEAPSFTGSLQGTASWAENALTSSYLNPLNQDITITGSVYINGTASIDVLNVRYISSSIIYSSGSNQLGDNTDDTQTLIGTVVVSGSQQITGSVNITGSAFQWNGNTVTTHELGVSPHVPYFKTADTLATSSIYQSGSTSIIINQNANTTANPEALYVWQPHPTSINVISGKGDVDDYLQLNIQNTNQGEDASSDVVATANNGNETSNYIDMGINSENYAGFLGGPNDAYLYSTGDDLWIGNYTNGKNVYFFNNTAEDPLITLTPSNTVDVNTTLNASDITGSLEGTASWARNTISASHALNADNAHQALTASYVQQAQTAISASHAINADNATYAATAGNAANGGVTQLIAGSGITLIPPTGLGTVTIVAGGGLGGITIISGSNVTQSFNNLSTWTFNHDLGVRVPVIQAFDSNYNQLIPQSIVLTDETSSIITFPVNKSGFAIASIGGVSPTTISASYSLFSTYANTASYAFETDPVFVARSASLATTGSNLFRGNQTITGSVTITGSLTVSGSNTFTKIGPSIFSGSVTLVNGATGSLFGTASFASTASFVSSIFQYEIHVSQVDGNDTTGNGDLLKPVATIGKALLLVSASVASTDRRTIIVHPGTYIENITINTTNTYFFSTGVLGANCLISGSVTISAATRMSGIKMTNLIVSSSNPIYINNCAVDKQMTVSGSGYLEVQNTSLQCTSGIQVVGPASSGVIFENCSLYPLTVNNASAAVYVISCNQAITPTLTAGALTITRSTISSLTSGATSTALTTAAGSVLVLESCNVYNSLLTSHAAITANGFYSIKNVIYNRSASTLASLSGTGGPLATVSQFQYINADNINSTQGLTVTGSLNITGSQTITGSLTLSSGSALRINNEFYVDGNKQFNYGQFSSTQTQSGSADTAYSMTFNTTDFSQGVSLVAGSRITVANTGIYNIQFSSQLHTTANQAVDFSIWFAITGSNIANSNTDFSIEKIAGGGFGVAALNFLTQIQSGSYVELKYSKTTLEGQLQAKGTQASPSRPSTPSAIVTITQVA
jgi:hypothetical protein